MEKIICPICGTKTNRLNIHLENCKNYEWNQFCKDYDWPLWKKTIKSKERKIKNENLLTCPICNRKFDRMVEHVSSHGFEWDHFCNRYEWPLWKKTSYSKEDIILNETNSIKCEICGKYIKRLKFHVLKYHNISWEEYCLIYKHDVNILNFKFDRKIVNKKTIEEIEKIKNDIINHIYDYENDKNWVCLICGCKFVSMKRHIQTHNITWEEYCENTGWDISKKQIFSKDHIKSLSENKKDFYQTERGIEMRKNEHHDNWSGEKNPAKKDINRLKNSILKSKEVFNKNGAFSQEINEKRSKTMIETFKKEFKNRSNCGYQINFFYDNIQYHCRSFEEFKIIYTLLINNVYFEYEKYSLSYIREEDGYNLNSLIDLKIDGKYFEIKGTTILGINKVKQESKYKSLIESANKENIEYNIINYELFINMFGFEIISNWEMLLLNILKNNKENYIIYQNMMCGNNLFIEKNEFDCVRDQLKCINKD